MNRLVVFVLCSLIWLPMARAENLVQIYQLAVENDAQIREAKATRDSALEYKPQAVAELLPTLALTGETDRVHTNVVNPATSKGSSKYTNNSLTLSLSLPIFRKDLWVQLDQADDQIAQAEATYAAAQQELIIRTAQAYFDILSAKDSLKFAKAETAAIARQLDQAKQRFDVGLIAITAVHEAQAAYDQSQADLILAENALDNAWEALYEIIQQKVSKLANLDENIVLSKPVPQSVESWASTALQQNLSIKAAEKATSLARKNVKLQQAGHYPTLDLVGAHTRNRTNKISGAEANTASVGLEFSLPLYAGGGVSSLTRQARYDLVAAQENLDKQRRSVTRQVRDAYREVLASISAVKALKASTVSSKSALEATEAGYEVGTRTIVDVLNSQRDLYRSLKNYSDVRYRYIMSGLRLKQAAGSVTVEDLKQIAAWLR